MTRAVVNRCIDHLEAAVAIIEHVEPHRLGVLTQIAEIVPVTTPEVCVGERGDHAAPTLIRAEGDAEVPHIMADKRRLSPAESRGPARCTGRSGVRQKVDRFRGGRPSLSSRLVQAVP